MKNDILKKSAPTFLSITACAGMIGTAVLAAKETPKALQLLDEAKSDGELSAIEAAKVIAPAYIPAIILGTATIVCIIGSNVLNKRSQAALASAYALTSEAYKEYKAKVIDICGKETHERIMQELAVEKTDDNHPYVPAVFGEATSLEFEGADEEKHLFYDSFSERYFESTLTKVLEAEYHLNRNIALGMYACLNDFYDLLGLEHTPTGEKLYWSLEEYMWVDFNHIRSDVDDMKCWIIECSSASEPLPE